MRGIQYAAAFPLRHRRLGILDRPLEPVIGLAEGETRWRAMTARALAMTAWPNYSAACFDSLRYA
jgi:hypothetical protein